MFLKLQKLDSDIIFYSKVSDASQMNCISRRDKEKNLFVETTTRKSRWNLYSQIPIENDMLVCAKTVYKLTDICKLEIFDYNPKTCTLLDTNEVVDIGYDFIL